MMRHVPRDDRMGRLMERDHASGKVGQPLQLDHAEHRDEDEGDGAVSGEDLLREESAAAGRKEDSREMETESEQDEVPYAEHLHLRVRRWTVVDGTRPGRQVNAGRQP
jgi:hypothetical protein